MVPLEQELRSDYSSVVGNMNADECTSVCSSDKRCRVASISNESLCHHYQESRTGIWKSSKIDNNSRWFAKLQNNGM